MYSCTCTPSLQLNLSNTYPLNQSPALDTYKRRISYKYDTIYSFLDLMLPVINIGSLLSYRGTKAGDHLGNK